MTNDVIRLVIIHGRRRMDRVILLALLGIPVLVIIHVALFARQTPPGAPMISANFSVGGQQPPLLLGHWRSPR